MSLTDVLLVLAVVGLAYISQLLYEIRNKLDGVLRADNGREYNTVQGCGISESKEKNLGSYTIPER